MSVERRADALRELIERELDDVSPLERIGIVAAVVGQLGARLWWPERPSHAYNTRIGTVIASGFESEMRRLRALGTSQVGRG